MAIDQYEDGSLVAEIDDGERAPVGVPDWLDVLQDVCGDEAWTGAALAVSKGRADL